MWNWDMTINIKSIRLWVYWMFVLKVQLPRRRSLRREVTVTLRYYAHENGTDREPGNIISSGCRRLRGIKTHVVHTDWGGQSYPGQTAQTRSANVETRVQTNPFPTGNVLNKKPSVQNRYSTHMEILWINLKQYLGTQKRITLTTCCILLHPTPEQHSHRSVSLPSFIKFSLQCAASHCRKWRRRWKNTVYLFRLVVAVATL